MLKLFGALLVLTFAQAVHKESFCGSKDAEPKKTCISVRLPWQHAPVYFCTEKENIKYKNRCNNNFLANYCGSQSSSSLLVATPWDCCPLSSTPDYCTDRSCPGAPFNRTSCKELAPDPTKPWDCCPTYFCEEGEVSSCQMKRLEPSCLTPPKDKANCVTFKDEHGCCNKFQCEGEGKPGMCPAEAQGKKFREMMENGNSGFESGTSSPIIGLGLNDSTIGLQVMDSSYLNSNSRPITTDLRCVGDFNCPKKMKCCSPIMSTYYDYEQNGIANSNRFGDLRDKAIYGTCMEPVYL